MTCEQELCERWDGHTCVCAAIDGDPDAIEALSNHIDEFGPALPLPMLCNTCGRALANVGEWCCGLFTTAADVTDTTITRESE